MFCFLLVCFGEYLLVAGHHLVKKQRLALMSRRLSDLSNTTDFSLQLQIQADTLNITLELGPNAGQKWGAKDGPP